MTCLSDVLICLQLQKGLTVRLSDEVSFVVVEDRGSKEKRARKIQLIKVCLAVCISSHVGSIQGAVAGYRGGLDSAHVPLAQTASLRVELS